MQIIKIRAAVFRVVHNGFVNIKNMCFLFFCAKTQVKITARKSVCLQTTKFIWRRKRLIKIKQDKCLYYNFIIKNI